MKPLHPDILIVDDEPGIRLMLRTTLEDEHIGFSKLATARKRCNPSGGTRLIW